MPTIRLTPEEAFDLVEDAEKIATAPWRHGTIETFVFEKDGAHWRASIHVHHSEGWQIDSSLTATRVVAREETVTRWVEG